jgi:alpha-tubulin suppressor-like RCC1 family protein
MVALAAATAVDCLHATQITLALSLSPNLPCARVSASGAVSIYQGDDEAQAAVTECTGSADLGTLVFAPGTSGPIRVTVVAGLDGKACGRNGGPGCVVARRKLAYVPHTPLRLPIVLDARCADVTCDPESTCFEGACVPAEIVGCTSGDCLPPADGGASDAGTPDGGGTDAALDGGVGYVGVAAGNAHTCALLATGVVRCWGANGSGELGDGTTVPHAAPAAVPILSAVEEIGAAGSTSCARVGTKISCWGSNLWGNLGSNPAQPPDNGTYAQPRPVALTARSIAMSPCATAAIDGTNKVWFWGSNQFGQFGIGTAGSATGVPLDVMLGGDAVALGASGTCPNQADGHACRIQSGAVFCAGHNGFGQCGSGTGSALFVPAQVPGLAAPVARIAAGAQHTCAVDAVGVKCWGRNAEGQLGASNLAASSPTPLAASPAIANPLALAAGGAHACAIDGTGRVVCWGRNVEGQLGDGSSTQRSGPVAVSFLMERATHVAAGANHTCARLLSGKIACWGSNAQGQLGDPNPNTRTVLLLP